MLPDCVKPREFSNWALTSDALEWIARFVEALGIRKVVECGSGLSTIMFGSLKLQQVLSLEHNSNWYAYTRYRLQEKGLLEYVDLQLCQLQQSMLNGMLLKWYDINLLSSFKADLILVDGPPGDNCLRARYPAPHLLKAFIQPGTWLLLDDYYRKQETEIVDLWLKEIAELELIKVVPFKNGLAVLRYNGLSRSKIGDAQGEAISKQSNLIKLNGNVSFLEENKPRSFTEDFLISKSLKKQPLNIQIHQKPLVSIIIPCYNAGKMIERCLHSCFQQVYPNIEIIIVDNNSTDDSILIARELASTKQHRVIFTQCFSQGQNYAHNHGFTLATGDYIQWLDADDELTPNKIALQVAALEQDCNSDIAYGDWEWCFYENGEFQRSLVFSSQHLDDPLRYFLLRYWHPPHTYLLRRSAARRLDKIQAWHPHTSVSGDTEYFTLAAILGLRFLYVPGAIVRYNHWSSTQMSRSVSYWERTQSWKQMGLRFQLNATEQSAQELTPEHWFLFRLNWDFWKLAPTQLVQEGERCFWFKHLSKNIGMTLTPAEARIVLAMKQLDGVDTLIGHTNQIIRLLWKQVVLQPGVNETNFAEALSRCVGLLPHSQPVNLAEIALQSPPNTKLANLHTQISMVPLHAPLFTEQRFAILRLLDKLRVAGFLNRIILKPIVEVLASKNSD